MSKELSMARGQTLNVIVRARIKDYYKGEAAALSSFNKKGAFDILPRHAHFISLISGGIIVHKPNGLEERINFSNAVLKVKDDFAEVYIGLDT